MVFFFDVKQMVQFISQFCISVRNVSQIHLTHDSPYIASAFAFTELSSGLCIKLLFSFYIFSHSAVIETAMKYIVTEKPSGGLAYQDLFFREVRNVLLCVISSKDQLKCNGTRAETRFRLSAKWTSPFKSAGASVPSTTSSRGVRISGSNAGYTMFWGSVKGTGYPLHSPVSPSLPLPCVTMCHHISTGVYHINVLNP